MEVDIGGVRGVWDKAPINNYRVALFISHNTIKSQFTVVCKASMRHTTKNAFASIITTTALRRTLW